MIVWTQPKPVTDLAPGDIVVMHGQARYLQAHHRNLLGYADWTYTRFNGPASTITGRTSMRLDSTVNVVCVTLDGSILATETVGTS